MKVLVLTLILVLLPIGWSVRGENGVDERLHHAPASR